MCVYVWLFRALNGPFVSACRRNQTHIILISVTKYIDRSRIARKLDSFSLFSIKYSIAKKLLVTQSTEQVGIFYFLSLSVTRSRVILNSAWSLYLRTCQMPSDGVIWCNYGVTWHHSQFLITNVIITGVLPHLGSIQPGTSIKTRIVMERR